MGGDCVTTRKTLGGGDNFCLVNTIHARLGGGLELSRTRPSKRADLPVDLLLLTVKNGKL